MAILSLSSNEFTTEAKDLIPFGDIDWFQNPIPSPNSFDEGNVANISPTIYIDISLTLGVIDNINMGASCSPIEITDLKNLFQEFQDIFTWSYKEMPRLDPAIVEHHIDT